MTEARITIDTQPFLNTFRQMASQAGHITIRFTETSLELAGQRVSAQFPGEGLGRFELLLNVRQSRWLSQIPRRGLPKRIEISAGKNTLKVHKSSMSWEDENELSPSETGYLQNLDHLAAYTFIDHDRLVELGLWDQAKGAHDDVDEVLMNAARKLARFHIESGDLWPGLSGKLDRRREYWREIKSPLAREAEAFPRKRGV